ncbi:hypothetical protein ACSNOI_28535 [Actinomadura kijaniata]|uniref:hypothetical protein n=1 Tax=Actinomadura kijaniata TaxID=46161 RepID=UPI003F1DF46C
MRAASASLLIPLLATFGTTLSGVVAPTFALPRWGRAGGLPGHKRMLLAALALFEIGSAGCAAAQDTTQLVAAGEVQAPERAG